MDDGLHGKLDRMIAKMDEAIDHLRSARDNMRETTRLLRLSPVGWLAELFRQKPPSPEPHK